MKNKYILVLISLFFINCSLDTFKKENLASWSIDVETPMYKSNLTLHKLLKDFEELTIEPFETSGDSIFAFTVSHFDSVVVPNFTITKAGGFIVPIPVPVLGYDVEVPILPEELDGMNLVDIDLSLIFDLTQINITLLDSVIVSLLTLTATNDDGEIVTAQLTNQDVLLTGELTIDNPEDLINIRPTSVIVAGLIIIYPSDQPGEQVFDKKIVIESQIHAPLILEISGAPPYDFPISEFTMDSLGTGQIENITVFADIVNQLEIGGDVTVLMAQDSTTLKPISSAIPDTLVTFRVLPENTQTISFELTPDKFELLTNTAYIKAAINIIGRKDAQDNPLPTRFFTNDSLKLTISQSAQVLIDPQSLIDQGE